MIRLLIFIILTCIYKSISAQDTYRRMTNVDVQRYVFNLALNDSTSYINGIARIDVQFDDNISEFYLDLISKTARYGMTITSVKENGMDIPFIFVDDQITIHPKNIKSKNRTYEITYSGIPEKGLVIDTTKYGARSFFGDNWPNRARYWLPCIDHPYDKAKVEFVIDAPAHYDVVATGVKVEESYISKKYKRTHFVENADVPMKVVTIGVTQFATKHLGAVGNIPISAWVYPENRLDGFGDYQVAVEVMEYFINNIGPYSYGKLANMQAKTQWCGLENAGTISYNENSVTGKNTAVRLIAHEIAHQWFGNSASEGDWNHVWLSEGFATYFAILFLEHKYGLEKRVEELINDRKRVIAFYQKTPSPIVDLSITNPLKVLNTNTYQKGSWILHMLRSQLGDELFWKAIQQYYLKFQNGNALTNDLKKVFEEVSGISLDTFFDQWIYKKGFPKLKFDWQKNGEFVTFSINQLQKEQFTFTIQIAFRMNDGSIETFTYDIKDKIFQGQVYLKDEPVEALLDPETRLLFELIEK